MMSRMRVSTLMVSIAGSMAIILYVSELLAAPRPLPNVIGFLALVFCSWVGGCLGAEKVWQERERFRAWRKQRLS